MLCKCRSMRIAPRVAACILLLANVASHAAGQTSASTHKPPVAAKLYCQPNAGFCFRYPGTWTVLGEVFSGNGVVIAPAQKGERTLWDAITVALVAMPDENGDGPSLDKVIDQTAADMRGAGQNFQTLQRKELTVDHNPAQMLKAGYRENSTGRDWIEELVFIQGQENEIYSVSLKCAPQNLSRLEPALKQLLASWTSPAPSGPSEAAPAEPAPPQKTRALAHILAPQCARVSAGDARALSTRLTMIR